MSNLKNNNNQIKYNISSNINKKCLINNLINKMI